MTVTEFQKQFPSKESYWRSIVLFGRNVASYKFSLAKSLLEVASHEKTTIAIDELAVSFSENICKHLLLSNKQTTSNKSTFIEACSAFNEHKLTKEKLVDITLKHGFNYVFDAFHIVNQEEIPVKFFSVERGKQLIITDELLNMKSMFQFDNLPMELEARWRLVETAWSLGVAPHLLSVSYNENEQLLSIIDKENRRQNITSCRDALNGYQKGKCFYCFADISISSESVNFADVDHFFPHTLMNFGTHNNLDGIWNLVLACQKCNRGEKGKFALVPLPKYLERLHRRNNFLINSHHPLRETLILQTGSSESARADFLREQYKLAINHLIHHWSPETEFEAVF